MCEIIQSNYTFLNSYPSYSVRTSGLTPAVPNHLSSSKSKINMKCFRGESTWISAVINREIFRVKC